MFCVFWHFFSGGAFWEATLRLENPSVFHPVSPFRKAWRVRSVGLRIPTKSPVDWWNHGPKSGRRTDLCCPQILRISSPKGLGGNRVFSGDLSSLRYNGIHHRFIWIYWSYYLRSFKYVENLQVLLQAEDTQEELTTTFEGNDSGVCHSRNTRHGINVYI